MNHANDAGVLYLSVGEKHALHLAVSTYSLRRHWHGPVAIICDEASYALAQRIALSDARRGAVSVIEPLKVDLASGVGRGMQYAHKTRLPELSPFKRTIFIDADTVVKGDLSPIAPPDGMTTLTRFANWTTVGNKMKGRCEGWREVAPDHVKRMTTAEYPALNTGVMGWSGDGGAFARAWREMTMRRVSFICDEIAAQLIYPDFPVKLLDDRFNASVIYSKIATEDVVVWHGHGKKFLRRPTGQAIFRPVYEAARRENWAGLADLPEPAWRFEAEQPDEED